MAATIVSRGKRLQLHAAAATLAVGDLVYLNSDGKWAKARADDAATRAVGVVTTAAEQNQTPDVRIYAVVSGLTSLTRGATYYLSVSSAGTYQAGVPNVAGNIIQVVGFANSTTQLTINVGQGQYCTVADSP